jgi:protein TonB
MTLATPQPQRADRGDAPGDKPAPQMTPVSVVESVWQPSTRYADQPMSLKTRLFGIGGVAVIVLAVLVGALFTWTTYQATKPPATLSVFDVGPPAAPHRPQSEIPPGPEQVQKERQRPVPDVLKIDTPEIQVPRVNPLPVMAAKPVSDPGPPVKDTTTPESKPASPAPQVSTGKPTWEGLILGALNKAKRYPRIAQQQRHQGVPWIRFTMDREGKVLSVNLERSSGIPSLDREAIALPKRAQPLPKPPEDVQGDRIELVVPVEFFLA